MLFLLQYLWILFVYGIFSWLYISLVSLNYKLDYFSSLFWGDVPLLDKFYDYVIVGAGTAGCILAARLSENASVKVLLVEAGGPPSPLFDIPLAAPMLQQTAYDWQFKTEPQRRACLAMNDKRSLWPRGKVLGGTSRLNYLIYTRGHPADFDSWLSEDCAHWSRSDVKYYFKRSENQLGTYANDTKHHGTHGLIPISDLNQGSGLVEALLGAARELNLGVGDLNGAAEGTGFMEAQSFTKNGARYSADRMLSGRPNLRVMLHTHATKVLLRQHFEAYGVRCAQHDRHFVVHARKEVIISAGTVGSPHLLMLSGIGPAEHLAQHKIKVAVDLPVGENLQDHVSTGLDLIITNQSSPLSWHTAVNPLNPLYYLLYGKGPLTHPGCEVVGAVHSDGRADLSQSPDLQFMVLPGGLSSDAGVVLKRVMGISDKLFRDYFAELVGTPLATLLPTVLHPRSRGFVKLQSPDYHQPPIIDPQYLSHPYDVEILVKGVQLVARLAGTEAMRRVGSRVYAKPLPPCAALWGRGGEDQAYWECYVRHITVTAYHPVGTCRMGASSDPSAVVDHHLRVLGTSRLRVVDASVMPTLPSANINAAVLMIAEKAADLIKSQWNLGQAKCQLLDLFLVPSHNKCSGSVF